MTDQFDLFGSKAARDAAIAQVEENAGDFMDCALFLLENGIEDDALVTGETVRKIVTAVGIVPHHPNAWGALIRTAVKRGLLIETGQWRQMEDIRSHARRTPLYRKARP